ncbi:MAG: hypothetical protein E2O39_02705 [Planctomycetota bacterium]|nr:MAG: hypothetical protein E2O39_02705 [Planctomycetota bacterium]
MDFTYRSRASFPDHSEDLELGLRRLAGRIVLAHGCGQFSVLARRGEHYTKLFVNATNLVPTFTKLFVKVCAARICGTRTGPTPMDGFLRDHRVLICDRDTKFTPQFKRILRGDGVDVAMTPRQAPNCNAFAERFVLSIKSECLRRIIFFGEGSLRRAVSEYIAHYHVQRAHQGIGNERIEQRSEMRDGEVQCTERLGGLLKFYRRVA